MGTSADQLRTEIELTRADMTGTVDEIGERMSPRRMVERRTDRIRGSMRSARETVMGAADHASDRMNSAVGDDASWRDADPKAAVVGNTRGNPLAAGAIAFAGGLLLASVIPSSRAEQDATDTVLDRAQPLVDQVRDDAETLTQNMRSSAREAAGEVKGAAMDAKDELTDHARDAATEVKEHASSAAADVTGEASDRADQMKAKTTEAARSVRD